MDTAPQFEKSSTSVTAQEITGGLRPDFTDCFLTYANQLVEQILRDYQIEVSGDADFRVA